MTKMASYLFLGLLLLPGCSSSLSYEDKKVLYELQKSCRDSAEQWIEKWGKDNDFINGSMSSSLDRWECYYNSRLNQGYLKYSWTQGFYGGHDKRALFNHWSKIINLSTNKEIVRMCYSESNHVQYDWRCYINDNCFTGKDIALKKWTRFEKYFLEDPVPQKNFLQIIFELFKPEKNTA